MSSELMQGQINAAEANEAVQFEGNAVAYIREGILPQHLTALAGHSQRDHNNQEMREVGSIRFRGVSGNLVEASGEFFENMPASVGQQI